MGPWGGMTKMAGNGWATGTAKANKAEQTRPAGDTGRPHGGLILTVGAGTHGQQIRQPA